MILQSHLPYDPLQSQRLPGIAPVELDDWLQVDDAFAGQMAYREALLAQRRDAVYACPDAALPAAAEALDLILKNLPQGFERKGTKLTRPDGGQVDLTQPPLLALGHMLQEDVCILEKPSADEHVLSAAALCFPASWRLAEKLGRPMTRIHDPVEEYDNGLARRVQRMFDAMRPGQVLRRYNALWYADPELHQPRSSAAPRPLTTPNQAGYLRSERQCLVKLPRTQAIIFTIHTYVVAQANAPRV